MSATVTQVNRDQVLSVIQPLAADQKTLQANWCLPPESAMFLYILAKASGAKRILEVGTSIGFSTLHLAWAAADNDSLNARVVCIDASAERLAIAKQNFEKAGLINWISCIQNEAVPALEQLNREASRFDLVFLDAQKAEYLQYLRQAEVMLAPGGLLVADNTQSHREQMQSFIEDIRVSPLWDTADIDTPNGFILARKR